MRTSKWRKSSNLLLSASLGVSLLLTGMPSIVGATTTSSKVINEPASAVTEFDKVYDLKNFKTGKLMIHESSVSITLDSTSTIKNGVVFTGSYATFYGDGFKDTSVTIKPKNAGAIVDFNGIEMSQVIIEGDKVSEIRGAGNVRQIDYVKGANPDAIKFPFDLSIMHTNDTHGNLNNIAKRVTAVKEVRAEKPNALLLDAGDVMSGSLYFNEFHGMADLQFMNLMGYDAMTFGNHEFDLGSTQAGHQALADFVEAAQFPFVSANVDFSKDDKFTGLFSDLISSDPEKGEIYNGIIKEINGEKVGIFGLTTPETVDISSPGAITFSDYIDEAERAVAAFENQGVDKIIALTHIGYDDNPAVDNDLILAATVDGIDVIVGGHSHTQLNGPVVVDQDDAGATKDPTLIVQAYQYNEFLGSVDVKFDKEGVITDFKGELIPVSGKVADPEAAAMLKPYSDRVEEVAQTEIGATAESKLENPRSSGDNTLPSVRKNETALGNLITDGMLAKAKTYNPNVIMALQNGGGIRAAIEAGPITVGEVITVLPFGNTLATMDLTGAELKEAFEISFREYPRENGGFLHVSGAKVTFDSGQPAGERVVSVSYKNVDGTYTEISDHETYAIATNAFTAKGGDGYTVFAKAYEAGRVTDLGLSDWENFAEHLSSLGNVIPKVEGRIIDVAE
jgi:5'-nucleotidase / UDP-sugar diphosphatase